MRNVFFTGTMFLRVYVPPRRGIPKHPVETVGTPVCRPNSREVTKGQRIFTKCLRVTLPLANWRACKDASLFFFRRTKRNPL